MVAASSLCLAQIPGEPAANRLAPITTTYFINSLGNTNASGVNTNGPSQPVNNGKTANLGISIAANGNVTVGWEDDDDTNFILTDFEAVWTLFDSNGQLLTPSTVQTDDVQGAGLFLTNKWVSYFRADNSAVIGATAWGPRINANFFGDGFGMGATAMFLSDDIAALAAWPPNNGTFPAVQLLNNNGTPVTILPGVSSAYAAHVYAGGVSADKNIRIADWAYLSNGNILIVGESRQIQDLVDIYGGAVAQRHVIFRILTPAGAVVKSETLASEFPVHGEMWNGCGVTSNGFALRFRTFPTDSSPSGATVRMFDNAGNPTTGNLDLATLTGHLEAGGGANGYGAGFHGNGNDAYVWVCNYNSGAWVTVLNTDGTVRYSRDVADDLSSLGGDGGADAAINSSGEVVVAFGSTYDVATRLTVLGRRFTAAGDPVGGTFFISEKDRPAPDPLNSPGHADNPRIVWRGNLVAVAWVSQNDPTTPLSVVARRLFSSTSISPSVSISRTGNNVNLSWPISFTGFTLESASAVIGATWSPVPGVVNNSVTVPVLSSNQFFRLKQ
jgi:hypothetical protein